MRNVNTPNEWNGKLNKIIIPKKWDDKTRQDLIDDLNSLSDDDIMKIWETIQQQKIKQEQQKKEQEQQARQTKAIQELKDYRTTWGRKIMLTNYWNMNKIVKFLEKVPLKMEVESDGSRLVEFRLWNKKYKILDPNLENHTDDEYKTYYIANNTSTKNKGEITQKTKCSVKAHWMQWDNTENWRNQKLKEYIKQKETEWLHIAKVTEILKLLNKLGDATNIDNEEDQIAMLMFLTGIDWTYRLNEWEDDREWRKTRNNITFGTGVANRWIGRNNPLGAVAKNLLMISKE